MFWLNCVIGKNNSTANPVHVIKKRKYRENVLSFIREKVRKFTIPLLVTWERPVVLHNTNLHNASKWLIENFNNCIVVWEHAQPVIGTVLRMSSIPAIYLLKFVNFINPLHEPFKLAYDVSGSWDTNEWKENSLMNEICKFWISKMKYSSEGLK